jgi:hypothetical protein
VGQDFTVTFNPSPERMRITIRAAGKAPDGPAEEELGLVMIRALMDSFDLSWGAEAVEILMEKKHRKISFD